MERGWAPEPHYPLRRLVMRAELHEITLTLHRALTLLARG